MERSGHNTEPLPSDDVSQVPLEIFAVDSSHLDPADELCRKVGGIAREEDSSTIQSQIADFHQARISSRRLQSLIKDKTKVHRHRKQLIVPRPLWPKVTLALAELRLMRIDDDLYGEAYEFVPTELYARQFDEFVELVELGDIDMIYAFVRKHPLHIDSLLVLSDFLRMSSATDAIELTERALYILEKCTRATDATGIDLTLGNLRMPYERFNNRRMHLALLRYVQFLIKRGCYRTAFEFSKILWSLDSLIDPLGVRLIVDFLAIKSEQYEWFDIVNDQVQNEAPWLANWQFSAALKAFICKYESSDDLLQSAIKDHPWMVPRLAEFCGFRVDDIAWREAFLIPTLPAHDHVRSLRETISKVYAQRSGPLWKTPNACGWLEKNMGFALSLQSENANSSMQDLRPTVIESLGVFRHAIMSDLNNVQVSLPVLISSGPVHLYDPLPPEQVIMDEDFSRSTPRCSIQ